MPRHRGARHCRCSSGMEREPKTVPHAGHCLSEVSPHCSLSMGTGSVGLSCLLAREHADTLMRAFGAQQRASWHLGRRGTREVNSADAGCVMPIGLICLTEPHCSVSNRRHKERSPAFPINAPRFRKSGHTLRTPY